MVLSEKQLVYSDTRRTEEIYVGRYQFDQNHPILANISHYTQKTQPQWDIHSGFEMGIILKGKVNRWQGSFRQTLTRGEVWLCNTWEPHGFCVLTPPADVLVIILWPAGLAAACCTDQVDFLHPFRLPASSRPVIHTADRKTDILRRAKQITGAADENNSHQKQYLLTKLLLLNLLDDIKTSTSTQPPVAEIFDSGPQRIIPAINLVNDNPYRRISLTEAAQACHICPALLVRLFRKMMGTSFAEYARRRRLAALVAELSDSTIKLASLAKKYGFTDTPHLTRVFKANFGVPPSHYRRNNF
jgi:AraC-like DNA-binding protein